MLPIKSQERCWQWPLLHVWHGGLFNSDESAHVHHWDTEQEVYSSMHA